MLSNTPNRNEQHDVGDSNTEYFDRVEVFASPTADALAYKDFSTVEIGFEASGVSDVENIIELCDSINDNKHNVEIQPIADSKETLCIRVEFRLSTLERFLWKISPATMSSRKRKELLDHFSDVDVSVRKMPLDELEWYATP